MRKQHHLPTISCSRLEGPDADFGGLARGEDMNKEIRGMLIGLCIVILAVAAYVLKEKPANAPDGAATTTAPERK